MNLPTPTAITISRSRRPFTRIRLARSLQRARAGWRVTYYYKDEFEEQGENDEAKPATDVIEFIGGDAAKFDGAIVPDENGNLVFTVGTARPPFIDELHTIKENNKTRTATDVLNPKWNNTSAEGDRDACQLLPGQQRQD